MKKSAIYIAVLSIAVLSIAVLGIIYLTKGVRASNLNPTFSCTPQPGEGCPSEKFVSQYNDFKKLRAEINQALETPAVKEIEKKTYQLNGMVDAINAQIPSGSHLDEKKMRFVPNPPSAPQAQPATQEKKK